MMHSAHNKFSCTISTKKYSIYFKEYNYDINFARNVRDVFQLHIYNKNDLFKSLYQNICIKRISENYKFDNVVQFFFYNI